MKLNHLPEKKGLEENSGQLAHFYMTTQASVPKTVTTWLAPRHSVKEAQRTVCKYDRLYTLLQITDRTIKVPIRRASGTMLGGSVHYQTCC